MNNDTSMHKTEPLTSVADNERFFVYIIESPGADDLLEDWLQGRALREALRLSGVPTVYSLCANSQTFREAIALRVLEQVQTLSRFPIIHLSMHGNTEGVELTNKEFMPWEALRDLLIPINQKVGGALIVCMSSCFGIGGRRMAQTFGQQLPFLALIGHRENAAWRDSTVGFITFYHHLRKSASIFEAVKAMQIASGDGRFDIIHGDKTRQEFVASIKEFRRMIEQFLQENR